MFRGLREGAHEDYSLSSSPTNPPRLKKSSMRAAPSKAASRAKVPRNGSFSTWKSHESPKDMGITRGL